MAMGPADDRGLLVFVWRGCVFQVVDGVQPPKAGSLFFARHVSAATGERALEIGAGLGVAAVLLARAGAEVVATDVVPEAVAAVRANASLNGVTVDARLGDGYAPVAGERFDLICSNPPQMPTPPGGERDDPAAAADNGGPDGWSVLDRIIEGAGEHLRPGGRLLVSLFAFLGRQRALAALQTQGLQASVLASETQSFPRLGHERLDWLRQVDREGVLPRAGRPRTVERLLIQGVCRP